MSKRTAEDAALDDAPRNETGKALFVRTSDGELITVMPGQVMPSQVSAASDDAAGAVAEAAEAREAARLAARSAEDVQYEAYLQGKDAKRGNVWIAGMGVASANRAALDDSVAAQVAKEREASGKEYAPARAHDRNAKVKGASRSGASSSTFGGTMSIEEARAGASAAQAALERARQESDEDDEDESLNMSAAELASKAMTVYNTPISNMPQRDAYGNDLRLPLLERKSRKFSELFAEDASVLTLTNATVLKDYEQIKARYGTVFRESGSELKAELKRRWTFEVCADDDGEEDEDNEGGTGRSTAGMGAGFSWSLDFEQHSSLVTPRPGLALDGSMGCTPPRTQDLVVLYQAEGGELTCMWIAPDKDGLGSDGNVPPEDIEKCDLFRDFKKVVARACGGARVVGVHQAMP